ncbi:glycosyl hydrolase 53 family protein [Paenibacillus sp. LjRoot56]|uniref:glycosyl hydrolase 53 family protein n=1 Tax=Paenibacillus sp. LjRoot56 TaxID=3342333 RepID=UPI003ECE5D66
MKKSLVIAMAAMLTSGILPTAIPTVLADSSAATTSSDIHINPIPGLSADFIKGADVSMLKQIEVSGGKFYDGGIEKEALQILKDHGVNWVRLRVWNNPVDANGIGLGGGNNDKARTIEIAKRAHELGLKVLLDFHYSDFWADPSKQTKPAAWEGLNSVQLQQALYTYTADVIQGLTDEGVMPEMVQIGNETNTGMVWTEGQTTGSGGYEGWANLIKQGVQAVRDHDPNNANALRTKIMIHLADGGNNELFRRNFDQLTLRQVDYDVIGFSYYPYWHGPLEDLQANMVDISKRYGKEVLVAENAYAYTLNDGDNFSNNFGPSQEQLGGYKATVQGQAQEVHDVMNAVAQVPNQKGLGVFYWEPDWIPVKGAEWSSKAGEGNGWENQAMFDFNGHALPSLDVFNRVSASSSGELFVAEATTIHPEQIKVTVGSTPVLPSKVQVEFTDDSVRDLPVTWDVFEEDALQHPGTIQLQGTVAGVPLRATGTITVQGSTNLVSNPGFESGNNANWTITGGSNAIKVVSDSANAHDGSAYALHYSLPQDMPFSATQTITGLANGKYTLKAWSHGGGGESSMVLFAKDYGGAELSESIVNTGWLAWKHPILMNIEVTNNTADHGTKPNGTATIGIKAEGKSGNWGNLDDFEFYTDRTAETLSAPSRVTKGSTFSVNVGNGGLVDTIFAEDLVIHYDSDAFEFVSAQSASQAVQLLTTDAHTPGVVRLILGHLGGKSLNSNSVTLTLRAKGETNAAEGVVEVASAGWGTAPAGGIITPASLGSVKVKLVTEDIEQVPSEPTNMPSTGAVQPNPVPAIELSLEGVASLKQTPALNDSHTAVASVSLEVWKQMVELAKTDANGNKKLSVILPKVDGANSYEQELPRAALQGSAENQFVEVITPQGTVSLPSNMLSWASGKESDSISLTVGSLDPSQIPDALKAKIGSKPVIDLKLRAGAEVLHWNNPAAPVTVTIPYEPTGEELKNLDHIVIWYVDENGQAIAVPNAKYDAVAHSVVFTTTHFSTYAVAYVNRTFGDLAGFAWAQKAVEALASKGVTTGTSSDTFSPEQEVSRADYIVMLVKALGLTANAGDSFQDVTTADYYSEAVGIAKSLGIIEGSDTYHFNPKANITREDLMVITARALHQAHRLDLSNETSTLDTFSDNMDVSSYAKAAIATLLKTGLVQGNGQGIVPKAYTTRAEAAVILYRLFHF